MAKLIPEAERDAALRNANFSDPVLRLAQGQAKSVHEAFVFWCETPWYGVFAGRNGRVPAEIAWGAGDTLLPLWGRGDMMTLFRTKPNGATDFVWLSIEDASGALVILGETEQGVLGDLIIDVIESQDWQKADSWDGEARQIVEDAARAVGFGFLPETFAFLDTVSAAGYDEEKRAWTRSL